jgi:hypothetical protein
METATARMIERKAFTVLKYSLLPARVRLPDGGANRRFDFDKRCQLFVCVHDKTLSVSRSHNAVICVYDEAGKVTETHEHAGDFKECERSCLRFQAKQKGRPMAKLEARHK